ncbi:MAG: hypothetical protein M3N18_11210 [Actinomycetota bacterium]|nr:hypothetical protein [Actinomycetota bacterium]
MIEDWREDWRLFKASKPGFRFRDRYRRRRRSGPGGFDFRKALYVVGGLAVAIASLLLAPLPGPGWGTFFVGIMILAGELRTVAHLLDRADVMLRGPGRWVEGVWARLPGTARILIGVATTICGAALGLWALLPILRWL